MPTLTNKVLTPLPHPGQPLVMGSMCAGSVRCYAAMLASGHVLIDAGEVRLPLRHSHHRYAIVGPNGVQQLTVHLVGSTNAMPVPMRDVLISEHAQWRHVHWGALYSAYGKSPYFDYIADDLHSIIFGNQKSLLELNNQLQQLIIEFLDLPIQVTVGTISDDVLADACDLRGRIGGKRPDGLPIRDVPYYQLWSDRHGFTPNLSILDLLMNCGREAIFTLQSMVK